MIDNLTVNYVYDNFVNVSLSIHDDHVFSKEFLVSQVFTKTIQDGGFTPHLIIEQLKREFCIPVYGDSFKNSSPTYTHDSLYYSKTTGTYVLNGAPAHGIYLAYPSGYLIYETYANSNIYGRTFYFFNGRLLPNKESYDFLEAIDDLFTDDVLPVYCPEVIDYFAYNPRIINGVLTTVDKDFNYIKYTEGSYVTLFSNSDKINVKNGVSSAVYTYAPSALEIFNNDTKNIKFNFEVLEKQILQFITNRLVDQDAVQ